MEAKKTGKPPLDLDKVDPRLANVYSSTENKQQKFDLWANTYEADLVNDLEYVAHLEATQIFFDLIADKSARILDLACGTGLVGQVMLEAGYANAHGADFSEEMLQIARRRNVYQSVSTMDVTDPVELEQPYDAMISVGLFSFGPPFICHLHHAVNCVKPGGLSIVTVNDAAWQAKQLEQEVVQESRTHGFVVEQILERDYIRKEGIRCQVLIIRSSD